MKDESPMASNRTASPPYPEMKSRKLLPRLIIHEDSPISKVVIVSRIGMAKIYYFNAYKQLTHPEQKSRMYIES